MGNKISNKGRSSRRKILLEAFKLFSTMPYERVSFSLMEEKTGISRGSMVYYFKNKEGLFKEILITIVFDTSSVKAVPDAYRLSLCSFYNYFIETLKREKQQMAEMGILNINEALMRIENSALTYIEKFKEHTSRWYDEEVRIWQAVIENAMSTGEIRNDLDPVIIGRLFEDNYLGRSFNGVFSEFEYDPDKLKDSFDALYIMLRKAK